SGGPAGSTFTPSTPHGSSRVAGSSNAKVTATRRSARRGSHRPRGDRLSSVAQRGGAGAAITRGAGCGAAPGGRPAHAELPPHQGEERAHGVGDHGRRRAVLREAERDRRAGAAGEYLHRAGAAAGLVGEQGGASRAGGGGARAGLGGPPRRRRSLARR